MAYNPQPPLGQATKSASLPVAIASDQGLLGAIQYTRPVILTGNVSIVGTSYAATQNVGGLITLSTGLPSGTIVKLVKAQFLIAAATISASFSCDVAFFNANPTSTTFTDNSATTLNAADIPKLIVAYDVSAGTVQFANAALSASGQTASSYSAITVDSSGKIYLAVQCGGAVTLTTPTALYYVVEFDY